MVKYLLLALLIWNFWVFCLMGVDKWKAKRGKRRISERTLLLSALILGSAGGLLGMYSFRHKTLHNRFRFGLPAMLALHLAIGAGMIYLYFEYFY